MEVKQIFRTTYKDAISYCSSGSNQELTLLGFPTRSYNDEVDINLILEKNPKLMDKKVIHCMLVSEDFFNDLSNRFRIAFELREKHLQIKKVQFVHDLFLEFEMWLLYNQNNEFIWTPRDYHQFCLQYNGRYTEPYIYDSVFFSKINLVNPFVYFSLKCNELREIIGLPKTTCFTFTDQSITAMDDFSTYMKLLDFTVKAHITWYNQGVNKMNGKERNIPPLQ